MFTRSVAGVLMVSLLLTSATAQETDEKSTISKLLTAGWGTKQEARQTAETLYQQFVQQEPGNVQVLYAYALVKMQQKQYADAVKLLEQYLSFSKTDLAAWRAKAWLSMLLKNYAVSLAELDKLSQLLVDDLAREINDESLARKRDEQNQEYVQFLGRMIGYLEGPANGSVNAATLEAAKKKLLARLDETHKPAFEEGRAGVVDAFEVMATAKDDAQAQEIATAEKAKRDTLANLEKEAFNIAERRKQLEANAIKVRQEAESEADAYAKADAPLMNEIGRLQSQAALIDRDLGNVTGDAFLVRRQLDRERDPLIRDRLLRELTRLDLLASQIDRDLSATQSRAAAVQAQRAQLNGRYQQSQAGYAASLQRADKEAKAMDNRLKRAEAERAQLKKKATGNTGKVSSLNAQAVALSTYETFPLEQEKQRLLDELN